MSAERKPLWRRSVSVVGLVIAGCTPVYYADYPHLTGFPERPISPDGAVEAAQPYLDQSFTLCRADRGSDWPSRGEPYVSVKLEGKYYKVLKDNYPYKSFSEHRFSHAVKVNAETGEVSPPE
jgi:hypothetical protein